MFLESFKTFFKNFRIIIPTIISSIMYFILSVFIGDEVYNELSYSYYNLEEIITPNVLALIFAMIIIFIIVSIFTECWTIYMSSLAVKGEPLPLIKTLKKSFKFYLRILGVYAIQFAICIGIFILLMIFSYTSFLRSSSGLFMFIALIAYICFPVIFIPIAYIIIEDNLGIIEGFSKGFKFGIKNFSSILGVNVLIIIILIFIVMVISGSMNIYDGSEIVSRLLTSVLFLIRGIYILKLYNFNKIKTSSTVERSLSNLTINSNVENQDN